MSSPTPAAGSAAPSPQAAVAATASSSGSSNCTTTSGAAPAHEQGLLPTETCVALCRQLFAVKAASDADNRAAQLPLIPWLVLIESWFATRYATDASNKLSAFWASLMYAADVPACALLSHFLPWSMLAKRAGLSMSAVPRKSYFSTSVLDVVMQAQNYVASCDGSGGARALPLRHLYPHLFINPASGGQTDAESVLPMLLHGSGSGSPSSTGDARLTTRVAVERERLRMAGQTSALMSLTRAAECLLVVAGGRVPPAVLRTAVEAVYAQTWVPIAFVLSPPTSASSAGADELPLAAPYDTQFLELEAFLLRLAEMWHTWEARAHAPFRSLLQLFSVGNMTTTPGAAAVLPEPLPSGAAPPVVTSETGSDGSTALLHDALSGVASHDFANVAQLVLTRGRERLADRILQAVAVPASHARVPRAAQHGFNDLSNTARTGYLKACIALWRLLVLCIQQDAERSGLVDAWVFFVHLAASGWWSAMPSSAPCHCAAHALLQRHADLVYILQACALPQYVEGGSPLFRTSAVFTRIHTEFRRRQPTHVADTDKNGSTATDAVSSGADDYFASADHFFFSPPAAPAAVGQSCLLPVAAADAWAERLLFPHPAQGARHAATDAAPQPLPASSARIDYGKYVALCIAALTRHLDHLWRSTAMGGRCTCLDTADILAPLYTALPPHNGSGDALLAETMLPATQHDDGSSARSLHADFTVHHFHTAASDLVAAIVTTRINEETSALEVSEQSSAAELTLAAATATCGSMSALAFDSHPATVRAAGDGTASVQVQQQQQQQQQQQHLRLALSGHRPVTGSTWRRAYSSRAVYEPTLAVNADTAASRAAANVLAHAASAERGSDDVGAGSTSTTPSRDTTALVPSQLKHARLFADPRAVEEVDAVALLAGLPTTSATMQAAQYRTALAQLAARRGFQGAAALKATALAYIASIISAPESVDAVGPAPAAARLSPRDAHDASTSTQLLPADTSAGTASRNTGALLLTASPAPRRTTTWSREIPTSSAFRLARDEYAAELVRARETWMREREAVLADVLERRAARVAVAMAMAARMADLREVDRQACSTLRHELAAAMAARRVEEDKAAAAARTRVREARATAVAAAAAAAAADRKGGVMPPAATGAVKEAGHEESVPALPPAYAAQRMALASNLYLQWQGMTGGRQELEPGRPPWTSDVYGGADSPPDQDLDDILASKPRALAALDVELGTNALVDWNRGGGLTTSPTSGAAKQHSLWQGQHRRRNSQQSTHRHREERYGDVAALVDTHGVDLGRRYSVDTSVRHPAPFRVAASVVLPSLPHRTPVTLHSESEQPPASVYRVIADEEMRALRVAQSFFDSSAPAGGRASARSRENTSASSCRRPASRTSQAAAKPSSGANFTDKALPLSSALQERTHAPQRSSTHGADVTAGLSLASSRAAAAVAEAAIAAQAHDVQLHGGSDQVMEVPALPFHELLDGAVRSHADAACRLGDEASSQHGTVASSQHAPSLISWDARSAALSVRSGTADATSRRVWQRGRTPGSSASVRTGWRAASPRVGSPPRSPTALLLSLSDDVLTHKLRPAGPVAAIDADASGSPFLRLEPPALFPPETAMYSTAMPPSRASSSRARHRAAILAAAGVPPPAAAVAAVAGGEGAPLLSVNAADQAGAAPQGAPRGAVARNRAQPREAVILNVHTLHPPMPKPDLLAWPREHRGPTFLRAPQSAADDAALLRELLPATGGCNVSDSPDASVGSDAVDRRSSTTTQPRALHVVPGGAVPTSGTAAEVVAPPTLRPLDSAQRSRTLPPFKFARSAQVRIAHSSVRKRQPLSVMDLGTYTPAEASRIRIAHGGGLEWEPIAQAAWSTMALLLSRRQSTSTAALDLVRPRSAGSRASHTLLQQGSAHVTSFPSPRRRASVSMALRAHSSRRGRTPVVYPHLSIVELVAGGGADTKGVAERDAPSPRAALLAGSNASDRILFTARRSSTESARFAGDGASPSQDESFFSEDDIPRSPARQSVGKRSPLGGLRRAGSVELDARTSAVMPSVLRAAVAQRAGSVDLDEHMLHLALGDLLATSRVGGGSDASTAAIGLLGDEDSAGSLTSGARANPHAAMRIRQPEARATARDGTGVTSRSGHPRSGQRSPALNTVNLDTLVQATPLASALPSAQTGSSPIARASADIKHPSLLGAEDTFVYSSADSAGGGQLHGALGVSGVASYVSPAGERQGGGAHGNTSASDEESGDDIRTRKGRHGDAAARRRRKHGRTESTHKEDGYEGTFSLAAAARIKGGMSAVLRKVRNPKRALRQLEGSEDEDEEEEEEVEGEGDGEGEDGASRAPTYTTVTVSGPHAEGGIEFAVQRMGAGGKAIGGSGQLAGAADGQDYVVLADGTVVPRSSHVYDARRQAADAGATFGGLAQLYIDGPGSMSTLPLLPAAAAVEGCVVSAGVASQREAAQRSRGGGGSTEDDHAPPSGQRVSTRSGDASARFGRGGSGVSSRSGDALLHEGAEVEHRSEDFYDRDGGTLVDEASVQGDDDVSSRSSWESFVDDNGVYHASRMKFMLGYASPEDGDGQAPGAATVQEEQEPEESLADMLSAWQKSAQFGDAAADAWVSPNKRVRFQRRQAASRTVRIGRLPSDDDEPAVFHATDVRDFMSRMAEHQRRVALAHVRRDLVVVPCGARRVVGTEEEAIMLAASGDSVVNDNSSIMSLSGTLLQRGTSRSGAGPPMFTGPSWRGPESELLSHSSTNDVALLTVADAYLGELRLSNVDLHRLVYGSPSPPDPRFLEATRLEQRSQVYFSDDLGGDDAQRPPMSPYLGSLDEQHAFGLTASCDDASRAAAWRGQDDEYDPLADEDDVFAREEAVVHALFFAPPPEPEKRRDVSALLDADLLGDPEDVTAVILTYALPWEDYMSVSFARVRDAYLNVRGGAVHEPLDASLGAPPVGDALTSGPSHVYAGLNVNEETEAELVATQALIDEMRAQHARRKLADAAGYSDWTRQQRQHADAARVLSAQTCAATHNLVEGDDAAQPLSHIVAAANASPESAWNQLPSVTVVNTAAVGLPSRLRLERVWLASLLHRFPDAMPLVQPQTCLHFDMPLHWVAALPPAPVGALDASSLRGTTSAAQLLQVGSWVGFRFFRLIVPAAPAADSNIGAASRNDLPSGSALAALKARTAGGSRARKAEVAQQTGFSMRYEAPVLAEGSSASPYRRNSLATSSGDMEPLIAVAAHAGTLPRLSHLNTMRVINMPDAATAALPLASLDASQWHLDVDVSVASTRIPTRVDFDWFAKSSRSMAVDSAACVPTVSHSTLAHGTPSQACYAEAAVVLAPTDPHYHHRTDAALVAGTENIVGVVYYIAIRVAASRKDLRAHASKGVPRSADLHDAASMQSAVFPSPHADSANLQFSRLPIRLEVKCVQDLARIACIDERLAQAQGTQVVNGGGETHARRPSLVDHHAPSARSFVLGGGSSGGGAAQSSADMLSPTQARVSEHAARFRALLEQHAQQVERRAEYARDAAALHQRFNMRRVPWTEVVSMVSRRFVSFEAEGGGHGAQRAPKSLVRTAKVPSQIVRSSEVGILRRVRVDTGPALPRVPPQTAASPAHLGAALDNGSSEAASQSAAEVALHMTDPDALPPVTTGVPHQYQGTELLRAGGSSVSEETGLLAPVRWRVEYEYAPDALLDTAPPPPHAKYAKEELLPGGVFPTPAEDLDGDALDSESDAQSGVAAVGESNAPAPALAPPALAPIRLPRAQSRERRAAADIIISTEPEAQYLPASPIRSPMAKAIAARVQRLSFDTTQLPAPSSDQGAGAARSQHTTRFAVENGTSDATGLQPPGGSSSSPHPAQVSGRNALGMGAASVDAVPKAQHSSSAALDDVLLSTRGGLLLQAVCDTIVDEAESASDALAQFMEQVQEMRREGVMHNVQSIDDPLATIVAGLYDAASAMQSTAALQHEWLATAFEGETAVGAVAEVGRIETANTDVHHRLSVIADDESAASTCDGGMRSAASNVGLRESLSTGRVALDSSPAAAASSKPSIQKMFSSALQPIRVPRMPHALNVFVAGVKPMPAIVGAKSASHLLASESSASLPPVLSHGSAPLYATLFHAHTASLGMLPLAAEPTSVPCLMSRSESGRMAPPREPRGTATASDPTQLRGSMASAALEADTDLCGVAPLPLTSLEILKSGGRSSAGARVGTGLDERPEKLPKKKKRTKNALVSALIASASAPTL